MVDILKLSKVHTFIKRLHAFITSLLYRKNVVVSIGDLGLYLAAFDRRKSVDTLFIPYEDKENLHLLYENFLNKFKKFHVSFLFDSAECGLRHDIVPIVQSIVKTNPIDKFIKEYFRSDEIVGYNVYNINTNPSESWNTMIVSTHYKPPLSTLLEGILSRDSTKYGGIYFLSLEFSTITDVILKKININKYNGYLKIFVCILETSGIKLVAKHHNNIVSITNITYPKDKPILYIQGLIEQAITDCLINLKNHIENYKLKVCIIFIVEQELANLLSQSRFGEHQVICKTINSILDNTNNEEERYLDSALTYIFNNNKSFPASNYYLTSISKLSTINSIMFKPLIVVIISLIAIISAIKIKTIDNYKKVASLNLEYSSAEREYYTLKKKYPYIKHATNLADLYVFEALLLIPVPTPFSLLEKFLTSLDKNFSVESIQWERLDLDNISLVSGKHIQITIFLKFTVQKTSIEDAKKLLAQHISNFEAIFSPMHIVSTILTDEVINFQRQVIIPVFITITDK